MIICPYCDAENIQGADVCSDCGHTLADLHLPSPATEVERSLLRDRLDTLAPKTPIVVSSRTSVGDVLQLLVARKIGAVFVVEGSQVVGVFTEKDALMRLGTRAAELRNEPISKFMTANPQSLEVTAKIAFAVRTMDDGSFRHIPVVSGGEPVGVISVRDILQYLAGAMTGGTITGDTVA
ncbi:MAG: CBS domain-containing protein [Pirellulaceae bacterium]|nr:CBS domain-containing protein [Planctomycetales bacterium]